MKKLLSILITTITLSCNSEYSTIKWEEGRVERYVPVEGEVEFMFNER